MKLRIAFERGAGALTLDAETKKLLRRAFLLTLKQESVNAPVAEIGVRLVSEEEIAALNAGYRGKDAPTDVLSFPMYDDADALREAAHLLGAEEQAGFGRAPQPLMLGDIVICACIAERQALEYGHPVRRELLYLFVHSLLHLLGHDHEGTEAERHAMRDAEEAVLRRLGLAREERESEI